jgi:hypothetical protein
MLCIPENLSRKLHPLKGKTAHRGVAGRCHSASGKTRLQAARPSGKNPRRATTARQTHLLPQTTQCVSGQYLPPASTVSVKPPVSPISGSDLVGAASVFNDTSDMTATLVEAAGGAATETAAKVGAATPFIGLGLSTGQLLHGFSTGNQDQMFDGGYGYLAFAASVIDPAIGIGMFLVKLGDDLSPGPTSSVLQLPNIYPAKAGCPATKTQ